MILTKQIIVSKKTSLVDLYQRCSTKMVFSEIPQISQENTCARIFFYIKLRSGKGVFL